MESMTSSEFVCHLYLLKEQRKEELTTQSKIEEYLAEIIATLVRQKAKNPGSVKREHYYVKYVLDEQTAEPQHTMLTAKEKLEFVKSRHAAFVGTSLKELKEGRVKLRRNRKR